MIKKYFSTLLLFFSLILLSYTFYKSEIVHTGSANSYYLKYYIISIILLLCSIVSFYLSVKIKINLIVIVSSIILVCILFEIILYFTYQKNYHESVMFTYLKKNDPDVYLKLYPSFYLDKKDLDLFPLSVASNKTIIGCKETSKVSIYESDRYGFNNPDDQWNKDVIELLLLGDSFTQGNCVNENQSISGNFRKLLNNKEFKNRNGILNFGQPATGSLIHLAILKEYIKNKKNIKNIIWFYYEQNDLRDLSLELKHPILSKYFYDMNYSQNLIDNNFIKDEIVIQHHDEVVKDIDDYVKNHLGTGYSLVNNIIKLRNVRILTLENQNLQKNIKKFYSLLKGFKNKTLEYQFPLLPDAYFHEFYFNIDDTTINHFKKITKQIKKIADNNETKLYFVYIPSLYRIENNKNVKFNKKINDTVTSPANNFFRFKDIHEIITDMGIVFIDLNKELFMKEKNPKKYFTRSYRSHFNKEGYKKVTETVYKKIYNN